MGAGTIGSSSSTSCLTLVLRCRGKASPTERGSGLHLPPQLYRFPSRTSFLQSTHACQMSTFLKIKKYPAVAFNKLMSKQGMMVNKDRTETGSYGEIEKLGREGAVSPLASVPFPTSEPKAQLN